ncbi:hypothetical protein DL764_007509 [Monosporascus ibericus]|uniref:Uncharacterized protein n=1 Tax=Monosporascus ibericus TaxID=155417 RepID=A0A4Q4T080_9PEZI|nr:hypothetical protein DL764_007509 [Monosporascus ibericus]
MLTHQVQSIRQATESNLQRLYNNQSLNLPSIPYASSLETDVERIEQVSPATRLRKRQIGSGGDDNERQLKRAQLTRKNLALFNKMTKRKGTNKASASAPPESTVEPPTTKPTSTTSSGFAIQARKNGILNPIYSKPPKTSRVSANGTSSLAERLRPPTTMVFEVGGQLLKKYHGKDYQTAFNQAFTAFPKDIGFNNGLSPPQPDSVEGLEMEEYRPFPVDEHVSGAVLYKDDPLSLTLPHLTEE